MKNLFPGMGNSKVVKILFPEKMIRDLLESHHSVKLCFQEKESPQLQRSQLSEINSLMADTIKQTFSETKFL